MGVRRALIVAARWLGHLVSLVGWLGIAVALFFLHLESDRVEKPPLTSASPDGRFAMVQDVVDPGAFGRARTFFALHLADDEHSFVFIDMVGDVKAVRADWTGADTALMSGVDVRELRTILRRGDQPARLRVRFGPAHD